MDLIQKKQTKKYHICSNSPKSIIYVLLFIVVLFE